MVVVFPPATHYYSSYYSSLGSKSRHKEANFAHSRRRRRDSKRERKRLKKSSFENRASSSSSRLSFDAHSTYTRARTNNTSHKSREECAHQPTQPRGETRKHHVAHRRPILQKTPRGEEEEEEEEERKKRIRRPYKKI